MWCEWTPCQDRVRKGLGEILVKMMSHRGICARQSDSNSDSDSFNSLPYKRPAVYAHAAPYLEVSFSKADCIFRYFGMSSATTNQLLPGPPRIFQKLSFAFL